MALPILVRYITGATILMTEVKFKLAVATADNDAGRCLAGRLLCP